MAKILVHCPLNISRALEEMLKEHCRKMQEKHGIPLDIQTQPHRPEEEGLLTKYLREGEFPQVMIGHVNDFAELPEGFLDEHFLSLPGRWPLRPELIDAGFIDPKGFFHLFVVIPFAMFYNPGLLEEGELPSAWEDLLDERWREKILMPDEYRMVSKIISTFMEAHYRERFNVFRKNVIFRGAPIDVVNAVDEGHYPVGITNIAFARISRNKNTRLIWPRDGMFCMPQVVVWSKGADGRLLEIGDYLMSRPVQEYLALQAFIPASPEVEIPQLFSGRKLDLRWEGWEIYLSTIRDSGL